MGNNPILYNDPLGDTLRGISNQDARRTQRIIRQSFQGSEARNLRSLFKRDGNTFKSISDKSLAKATANLSQDQKALAKGYKDVINSGQTHTADVLKGNERPSFESVLNFGPRTTAEMDKDFGGGVNRKTENGSHTAIVMGSTAMLKDYVNETGQIVSRTSSAGELLSHELLGHGLGRQNNSPTSQHADAIQATNLFLRITGINNLYREGSLHDNGAFVPSADAEAIPWYLK